MLKLGIIFIYLFVRTAGANPIFNDEGKSCESEQCKITGDIIKNVMSNTSDPCDNFYNYVCGGWESHYPRPNDEDIWNFDKVTEHDVRLEYKAILEEEENEDDSTPLKYEKKWYRTCTDTEKVEEDGTKLLEEIMDYFGGWPMTMNKSDWTDEGHDWQGIHEYYFGLKDLSSIFHVIVGVDDRNASQNVIYLNKPTVTLYDLLLKNENEEVADQKYSEFMKNIVLTFVRSANESISDEDLTEDVEDLLTFEKKLRQIKIAANESEDLEPSRTYLTIKDLQEFYNASGQTNSTAKIDWLEVFTTLFDDFDKITIDDYEEIGIEDTSYLRKLAVLLDETANRIIVNYVHWKFVSWSIQFTNEEMRDLYLQVTDKTDYPRWRECALPEGLGYRYEFNIRQLSGNLSKMASDMVSEVRGQLLDEIERSIWLDDSTKEETMIKLHALKWQIGLPNFNERPKFFEIVYQGLRLTNSFMENVQNFREFYANRNLRRLRHHRVRRFFVDQAKAVILYDLSRNVLAVTNAQLFVPMSRSGLPLSVNYGYMAPTMGRLMSRTMEKEVNTNIYMPPWSTYLGDTYKSYEPITDCLTKQYYNYSVGPSTLDENMYDAIGLKVAYKAFQSSVDNENSGKLPNLEEFSNDQLFFVSYALKYCQSETERYLSEHTPTFYTPNEFRVIGTLANFKEFADAFNCPVNSPMNPENKCIV